MGVTAPPRKPLVYLCVLLPLLVAGGLAAVLSTITLFARSRGIAPAEVADLPGILLSLSALFLWMPPCLMLGNAILWAIPPLRRLAEGHVRRHAAPEFRAAQRDLARLALGMAAVTLPVIAAVFAFAD